jgi:putative DNA primase/helicase
MSFHDAVADMIRAMELEGMKPVEPIGQRLSSGELIRFRCDGDGRGRQNGWAILYLDERPAGAFGNYRLGISRKWRVEQQTSLSAEERARLTDEWARAKEKRLEERLRSQEEAAHDAREIWNAAAPAGPDHPYAARKRLDPVPLKQADGKLLIPMYDAEGRLWNLQRIAGDGAKRFLRGGRTEGLFCLIGSTQLRDTICLGEGYSTMAAISRASGLPGIVAFSAANLAAVARIWNGHRPDLKYIVCADDDPELVDNPNIRKNLGVEAAKAVAEEIGARLALPPARAA